MVSPRFRSELPLIVASLFIAAVIWLIAKQADYEPDRLAATVVLNNVPDTLIVEALPPKVTVNVRYPKQIANLILERDFTVPINVTDQFGKDPEKDWPQTRVKNVEYRLSPKDVKSQSDEAVQVVSVDHDEIVLQGHLRTMEAGVKVNVQGELPGNLMLVNIKPDPPKVTFAGSPEALQKLAEVGGVVQTEPVDLGTLRAPGGQYSRPVILPHKDLVLLGQRPVTINASVAEKPVRQEIKDVPITLVTFAPNLKAVVEPATGSVVLEGPTSAVGTVGAKDIEFSTVRTLQERPGRVYEIGIEARLKTTVPAEAAKQIKIVETRPSRISVEFVPVDAQNK